jgi:putative flippase GtrA
VSLLSRQTYWSRLFWIFEFRVVRFLLVGGVNTLFGFAVFSLIAYLGGKTWHALLGGNVAGIVFNFITIGGTVFRDLDLRRAPRFVLAYLGLFALNLEAIELLSDAIPVGRIAVQALLTAPMAVLSYLIMSKLVFLGCGSGFGNGEQFPD